jgi:hypothetical protein
MTVNGRSFDKATDETTFGTTSHLTRQPEAGYQGIGYNHPSLMKSTRQQLFLIRLRQV